MKSIVRLLLLIVWGSPLQANQLLSGESTADKSSEVDFADDVLPILKKNCWACHGNEKQESGLRLDVRDLAIPGGDSGKLFERGHSHDSLLIRMVAGANPERVMPPEGDRLSPAEIGILRTWIDQGAIWPDAFSGQKERNAHWSYQPIQQRALPVPRNTVWPRNAIDHFVLAALEHRSLPVSPEAERTTQIRRLNLDLLGMLPTPEEVDRFIFDTRPDAYELLVDRLLASPHFGERWGRHWLDMARYADSDGYEKDNPRPDAFLWRDWVIQAINDDMPFDQFTIEQLAGDLLPQAKDSQQIATAFHRQTLTNTEGGTDQEQFRVEACFDRTETTGSVWLGLTIGCARCHSHKYDAISQREYYQLFSFFNNGDESTHAIPKTQEEILAYEKAKQDFDRELESLEQQLNEEKAKLDGEVQDGTSTKPLVAKIAELKKKTPPKPEWSVRVLKQRTRDPRATFVLRRGEFLQPLQESKIEPSGLASLPSIQPRSDSNRADRLDLAHWLVSRENPLTPRVTVNHVWRILFGTGLVRTASDMGVRGDPPTHPELLDWLALDFMKKNRQENGLAWSRKALIQRIVLSSTYRQSSRIPAELATVDPQNQWLGRQNRLRVEGEVVRDICLDSAGLLSRKIGGPSVYPSLPTGIAELSYAGNFKWKDSEGEDRYRRGMYTFFKRTSPHPNLIAFDCPDANLTCIDRNRSNTPLQSLVTLNNDSFAEAAGGLAHRVLFQSVAQSDSDRLDLAFRYCVARFPTEHEKNQLIGLLDDARSMFAKNLDQAHLLCAGKFDLEGSVPRQEAAAWIATARILINLDEFITRE